ncbi:Dabb family protein [Alkalihalobacillus sp. BA299]|uniref:Dabb family protein n=1 Tax=Alkalihalobacillus sp. BA299 TaxID=2815938 RepID=UPI001AD9839B|nr:Dabb family protein [Alkalihalobacillus sp. BA299]
MIQRTVLVKFSEATTEEQLQEVVTRFKALKNHLKGIVELQAGRNILERNKEFQIVLTVRFEDQEALDAYVADPDHQALARYIKEVGKIDSIGVDFKI